MPAARFVVSGLVQGVNFRWATLREAEARDLTGRVWNRDDGAVEVVAEGASEALAELEGWLRSGPSAARVERVERTGLERPTRYHDFTIAWAPPE